MRPERISVMGCLLDVVSLPEATARLIEAMERRTPLCQTSLNTAKLIRMHRDGVLRDDITGSDLVTADGMGIVLAARLGGQRLPGRVTGIDLMQATIAACAERGHRPYLLGARPGVLARAAAVLTGRHPGLRLAGCQHGYFSPADEDRIVAAINRSGADCLFVALPTPMKEGFIARNRARLLPPVVMGVGGSLDVIAGHVARAPGWMQAAGLEWMFRLIQEPRRMWRRYLVTNTVFAGWLIAALCCRVTGRRFAPLDGSS